MFNLSISLWINNTIHYHTLIDFDSSSHLSVEPSILTFLPLTFTSTRSKIDCIQQFQKYSIRSSLSKSTVKNPFDVDHSQMRKTISIQLSTQGKSSSMTINFRFQTTSVKHLTSNTTLNQFAKPKSISKPINRIEFRFQLVPGI